MKRRVWMLFLVMTLILSSGASVFADTMTGSEDWSVSFTAGKKMESNFKTSDLDDIIYGLQPGDDAVITLKLTNGNETTTNWYMTNEVLYSLEDRSKNSATGGGAYTYQLYYTNKSGEETVLFDSDTIGGDTVSAAGEGLHEATDALGDYFYLDTLNQGEGGSIRLRVALDGETQGNDYQDTLADLQMNFAVELNETGTTPEPGQRPKNPVQTGDDTDLSPFMMVALISGSLLLLLSLLGVIERRRERGRRQAV